MGGSCYTGDEPLRPAIYWVQVDLVLLGQPAGLGSGLPAHQRIFCWPLAKDRRTRWQSRRTGRLPPAEQERAHRVLVISCLSCNGKQVALSTLLALCQL